MLLSSNVAASFDDAYVSSFSRSSLGRWSAGLRVGVPLSGAQTNGRIVFLPLTLLRPYPVSRWFWSNGSTVSSADALQVGVYDENFNLLAASPKALGGTASVCQFVPVGLGISHRDGQGSTSDLSSYNTSSVTMKKGVLYLMSVSNSHASSASAVNSITATGGGAPTFTSRATTQYDGTIARVSVWSCVPSADYTGTLTVDFGGTTQTGENYALTEVVGADTATNDGIVQSATATGNSTTPSATLSAFGASANGTFFAAGSSTTSVTTSGSAPYFKLSGTSYSTPTTGLTTAARYDNDTTADGITYNVSAPWGAIGLEIKGFPGPKMLPPMRGWLAFHCQGSTHQILRSSTAQHQPLAARFDTGFGIIAPVTPNSFGGAPIVPLFGFTRMSSP